MDWATFERIQQHVRDLGRDTTVGAVAEALDLECDQVLREIRARADFIGYYALAGEPKASWPVFEIDE